MDLDARWAEPVVSHLTSVPAENNHPKRDIEPHTPVHSPAISVLPTSVLFPPQRVEPIDMARSREPNRHRIHYAQSATTDEHHANAPYMQNGPIRRLTHPADRSSLVFFLQRLSAVCLTIFISIPCVLLTTLLVPLCWLVRTLLRLTCQHRCAVTPCTCSYLSATDLFWFYSSNLAEHRAKDDETTKVDAPFASPTAAAIFFLEGAINENSLKKLLINRLITCSSRRGSNVGKKLFPRFSQLIVSCFSGTMWVDYSLFSIDDHVREIPRDIQSDEDLQSYASTLLSTELTHSRPLWQLHYKNRSSARQHDSILVFIYHPVLSDGVSLIRILLKHIVDNRTTQLDIKPRFVSRQGEQIFDYVKAYLFGHMLILRKLFFSPSTTNFFRRTNSKDNNVNSAAPVRSPQQRRIVVWSDPFSLTQAHRMKLVTRTRMNDLLSTVVISTVKLYMERYGISNSPDMNCIMPCDLRSNPTNIKLGNHVSHLCLELPMNIEGNIPILWSFNEHMKGMKQNGEYATMHLFTRITYLLFPLRLANKIVGRVYDSASFWMTTLAAGSSTALATVSLCNRDVRSLICLSPSVGTANINFCVTSYADEIRLTVVADPAIVPNPQFFTECFIRQLDAVHDLLAHRRIPGEVRRITRPPRIQPPAKSISSISDMSDDLSIEEIQAKMTILQQELLSLKSQFENVDKDDTSSQTQRLMITAKLEELRREFRELLIKLQERQCELSGMIPSDEEDEMDPDVRGRLRSASVASKISLRSNDQRVISARMYQLEKDEGSEFAATTARPVPSASKTSLSAQQLYDQQSGMRRAPSLSIYENAPADMQQQAPSNGSRPNTPSTKLSTTNSTTVMHLHPSESWKTGQGT